jgi:hypothetical protein
MRPSRRREQRSWLLGLFGSQPLSCIGENDAVAALRLAWREYDIRLGWFAKRITADGSGPWLISAATADELHAKLKADDGLRRELERHPDASIVRSAPLLRSFLRDAR